MDNKRGQVEIMGLVIIVVLLAVGLLLVLFFSTEDDNSARQSINDNIIASSAISTLRKTTVVDCHNNKFQELLEDCAGNQRITCDDGSGTCQKAEEVIEGTLGNYFTSIGRSYHLTITRLPYFEGKDHGTPCGENQEQEAHYEPIPVAIGYDVGVELEICR